VQTKQAEYCLNLQMEQKDNKSKWLKRAGMGAFLFFLAKGLVWLAVFFFAAKSCSVSI